MSRLGLKLLVMLGLVLDLTACATTTTTSVVNLGVCEAWKPVTWSQADTDQTILEIKQNNAARKGWGCAK